MNYFTEIPFKTAADLGIIEGETYLLGKKLVKVVSTITVPATRNQITVREIGDRHTFYACADSLKRVQLNPTF